MWQTEMTLWGKIETAPEAASFFAWKLRFGAELEKVAPWFLKPTSETARTIPCPLNCDCLHRVKGDRGICDCGECEDIALLEEDVEVWKANWTGLGNKVRDALKLERKASGFAVRNVWQIGSLGGDALQIILLVKPERGAFNEAIAQLAARVKGVFAILTPTAAHHDIESRDLLGRVGAGLFDLESNLLIQASGVVSRKSAEELFGAMMPAKQAELRQSEAKRIFELFRKLGSGEGTRKGPLEKVFRLMALDGANQAATAKRCECSEATISARVATIEQQFGMKIEQLQAYASEILEFDSVVKGDRRRRKKHGAPEAEKEFGESGFGGEDEEQPES